MEMGKYSFGIGDRFGHQGQAQLQAIMQAHDQGIEIVPVWNKSNREHLIVKTTPSHTRHEADDAVQALKWKFPYFVDADHINLTNVNRYIDYCDFFTIDVADYIGKSAVDDDIENYLQAHRKYLGNLVIPGLDEDFIITEELQVAIATKYLYAAQEAGKIYRHIIKLRSGAEFIPEVSMDEVDEPQTPVEMFFILSALSAEKIPVRTIAPKFTGRFNKGVDYEGDLEQFSKEFEQDLLVIDHAIREFNLPDSLKLSVHSGSDKISIYPVIGKLIRKYDKGIHVKTAGTTWLEEVIGLATAGGDGLDLARKIYRDAYTRKDELCQPYASVINIDPLKLPSPDKVEGWDSDQFANTLRHIPDHPDYNPHFRQLIHVGYKVAAEMGDKYYSALKKYSEVIGKNVTENIFERHIKRLFYL